MADHHYIIDSRQDILHNLLLSGSAPAIGEHELFDVTVRISSEYTGCKEVTYLFAMKC